MSRASAKPKKPQAEPEDPPPTVAEQAKTSFKPVGTAPDAIVLTRHEGSTIKRPGRGFSTRELLEVGMSLKMARVHNLQVDLRRRSRLEINVEGLKAWSPSRKEPEKLEKVEKLEMAPKVPPVSEKKRARGVKPAPTSRKKVAKKTTRGTRKKRGN